MPPTARDIHRMLQTPAGNLTCGELRVLTLAISSQIAANQFGKDRKPQDAEATVESVFHNSNSLIKEPEDGR